MFFYSLRRHPRSSIHTQSYIVVDEHQANAESSRYHFRPFQKRQICPGSCRRYVRVRPHINPQMSPNATQTPNTKYYWRLIRFRNSSRVLAVDDLMHPSMQLVMVFDVVFSTPRMTMQRWADSITTATPSGCRTSCKANATCFVSLSCTCSRRANISAILPSLESPITRPFGM